MLCATPDVELEQCDTDRERHGEVRKYRNAGLEIRTNGCNLGSSIVLRRFDP